MTRTIMAAKNAERISVPPGPIRRWALFLDIDGTLLDIAATPDAVFVPEALPEALRRLQTAFDGAVALISGRALVDIDRLFHAGKIFAAGQHGAELRLPGRQVVRARVEEESLAAMRANVLAAAGKIPGVLVEQKGTGVAVHYRRAPSAGDNVRRFLDDIMAACEGFEIVPGKMVFEIRPRGVDKGRAIEAFMQHPPFAGRVPIFVGDDIADRDGMTAVEKLGGYAVHVGGEAGAGEAEGTEVAGRRFWLPSPEFVRVWLAGLPGAVAREAARA
ncbi:MAG TPA: trehalose-phosphatase [Alphaproteobacteria bacterium]|nr:trehalose-phosphatase [Alphaproteobacteria bacterium]